MSTIAPVGIGSISPVHPVEVSVADLQQIQIRPAHIVHTRGVGRLDEIVQIAVDAGEGEPVDIPEIVGRALIGGSVKTAVLALNNANAWIVS